MEKIRMFLAALAVLITAVMAPNAWAQTTGGGYRVHERERISIHFQERVSAFEQHGSRGWNQNYQPQRVVPRDILQIIFGFRANQRERQQVRHAEYCPRGGQLGRLPGGAVACILAVEAGDPTVRTRYDCPQGGRLGAVPGADHDVCITEEQGPGQVVTVQTCPEGRELGWVRGVDHQVCVRS